MDAPRLSKDRARALRRRMSLPEVLLWRGLRRRGLNGRFRRQHPIGPYVLDFYCQTARLAVEVDGAAHGFGDQPGHDARRDAWLLAQGVTTLRISAQAVLQDVDAVLRLIAAELERRSCPAGGGGGEAAGGGS